MKNWKLFIIVFGVMLAAGNSFSLNIDDYWLNVHGSQSGYDPDNHIFPDYPQDRINYGWSLDATDSVVVVGAPNHPSSGSVYILEYQNDRWVDVQQIKSVVGAGSWGKAFSVAIDSETILFGSKNGALVFVRDGGLWIKQDELVIPETGIGDNNLIVDISGDTAIIAQYNNASNNGVYVFERTGIEWEFQTKILPSPDTHAYGFHYDCISVSGDTIAISMRFDNELQTDAGSVYIYRKTNETWNLEQKILPPNLDVKYFGYAIDIDGDRLLATSMDYVSSSYLSQVFEFSRSGSAWTYTNDINFNNAHNVSLKGDKAIVSQFYVGTGEIRLFTRDASTWDTGTNISNWPLQRTGNEYGKAIAVTDLISVFSGPKNGYDSNTYDAGSICIKGSGINSATSTPSQFISNDDFITLPANKTTQVSRDRILGNDTYSSLIIPTIQITQQPSNGNVVYENKVFSYTPTTGFEGNDVFYYSLYNGVETVSATVSVTVQEFPVLTLSPSDTVYRDEVRELTVQISDADQIVGYRVALDLDPSKVTYIDGSATKVGTSTEIGWGPLVVNSASPELAIFTCASATGTLASGPASLMKFQLRVDESLADFTPISVTFNPLTSLNEDAVAFDAEIWSATVLGPNHQPTFTGGPDKEVLEDSGVHEIFAWATDIDPGSPYEDWQSMYFTLDVDKPQLFFAAPTLDATGTLRYTLATDEFGICNATAVLHDSGSTANGGVDSSTPYQFTITVKPVNDAPSFVAGATVVVLNATGGQHTIANWATDIIAGPVNESTQTLSFDVETDRPEIFSATPYIAPSGTLFFTPVAEAHGVVKATATLYDDGGIADGGINKSSPAVFVTKIYIPYLWGDLNDNDQAGSVDASLLLQYAAELIDVFPGYPVAEYPEYYPDPTQPWNYFPLAADVNADGIAGTWDASYVLQKYAFLINWFPADSDHDQWGPDAPLPAAKAWKRSAPRTMNVFLEEDKDSVFVTYQIDNAEDVQGLRTVLFYDPTQLKFDANESGWLLSSGLMAANDLEPGRLVLAGALGTPLQKGPCNLITVKFDVVGNSDGPLSIEIDEERTSVNDGHILVNFEYCSF